MTKVNFSNLGKGEAWHILNNAARRALTDAGYGVSKVQGWGRSNVLKLNKNNKENVASVRTTMDRDIAFPPLANGWKTLDDVDLVVVAAVDSVKNPQKVEIYIFPADEVRKRFNSAYKARKDAGQNIKENFGMWVALDHDDRGIPASVGSGLAEDFEPIAVFPLETNKQNETGNVEEDESSGNFRNCETISEVLNVAQQLIAKISGVPSQNVKLDLHIGG
jgi:hypothetical protein